MVRRKNTIDVYREDESIMTIKTYNKQHSDAIQEMQNYINSFKKMEEGRAKKLARESLISSGVLNKNGTVKKKICN